MSLNTSKPELTPACCRICLAVGVRLHTIAGTPLQLVYENLTNISLHTADSRPVAACYICYALLYKSGNLLLRAAKAEKLLTDVFQKYSKITTESISLIDREANGLSEPLSTSRVTLSEYFDNILPLKLELDNVKTESALEDDGYSNMEFEDSIGFPQSPYKHVWNNDEIIQNDDFQDNTLVTDNANLNDVAGDLKQEITEDIVVEEHTIEENSLSRKRKHDSDDARALTNEEQYTCDNCQKPFHCKDRLKAHIKTCASQIYKCEKCSKQFNRLSDHKNHIKTHTETFECKICAKPFLHANYLTRHLKTMHESSTFVCDICKRKFSRKDYLKRHLSVHSNDKLYKCKICKQQYKDQSNFKRHLKHHTEGESHECTICHMKFTLLHHLKTHMKSHSGPKRFQCEYCPMTLDDPSNLIKHNRTHTGERPYGCNICKRRFNRRTHLRSHLKIHDRQAD